jgi:hypothetical protein
MPIDLVVNWPTRSLDRLRCRHRFAAMYRWQIKLSMRRAVSKRSMNTQSAAVPMQGSAYDFSHSKQPATN